ncbi:hypothetical protein D4764_04G0012430 [Takifugu flavidus]|uniref:Secreted protein n=1 Tax=Takifugu flavidus TaxID=433684 RepID=A0A5C6N5J9_9TELE|nr:hypothetical protein D4764_04G0012430 [Takifugu flavidus]
MGSGWWCTVGLWFGLRFLRTVTQPPWLPGCSAAAGGPLAVATLGGSTAATFSWLPDATLDNSNLQNPVSSSLTLASRAITKLHFLHLFPSLKEAEE